MFRRILLQTCIIVFIYVMNMGGTKDCLSLNGRKTCHSSNSHPYRYYGTKTAYHIVLERPSMPTLKLPNDCKPEAFYLLSRHATRYPDKEYIIDMADILPKLKTKILNSSKRRKVQICAADLKRLEEWTLTMKPEDDNRLSETGIIEAQDFAKRLKSLIPSLLNTTFSEERFIFHYTSRLRTKKTAEAFAKGLFDRDYQFNHGDYDEVLTFHRSCKTYRKMCPESFYNLSELEKFANSSILKEVTGSISRRVGFDVTHDEVHIAYKSCVFGYALNSSDAWCALFSIDELQVLEFEDDLDDYYKDAYGNSVNYEQACPIAKQIVDFFRTSEKGSSPPVLLQFTHAGAMKKVFALFGLFRDSDPLTADGLCRPHHWRSSLACPFTANLALLMTRCGERRWVSAFHNERPAVLWGCGETCDIDHFYDTYDVVAGNCDLERICSCT